MSTRSWIFMYNGEDARPRYRGIYCHHDGYLGWVGETLYKHYDTEDKVKGLIDLGDASSIDETLSSCYFYSRDGHEDLNIRESSTEKDLMERFNNSDAEYLYLFKDGKWLTYFPSRKIIPERKFIELTEAFDRVKKYEESNGE